MPPTKDMIIERLAELQIEHDPKANKDELLSLLPADDKPPIEDNPGMRAAPSVADSYTLVQLTRNAAGHLVGETFSRAGAKRLGILDHCRPFNPGK